MKNQRGEITLLALAIVAAIAVFGGTMVAATQEPQEVHEQ